MTHLIVIGTIDLLLLIGGYLLHRTSNFTTLEIGLMVALSALVIAIFAIMLYRASNNARPSFTIIETDSNLITKEVVHRWITYDSLIHSRKFTVKSNRNGLREFSDKFAWTGDDYEMRQGEGEYRLELSDKRRNIFNQYLFKFGKMLNKNETIRIEANWTLTNRSRKAAPFVSTTIEEPTELLVIELELNPEFGVKKVNLETSGYKGAKIPFGEEIVELDSNGRFEWRIERPKLLHHYEINWEMPKNYSL